MGTRCYRAEAVGESLPTRTRLLGHEAATGHAAPFLTGDPAQTLLFRFRIEQWTKYL